MRGWGARAFVWHEAADDRAVPAAGGRSRSRAASSGSATGATRNAARSCIDYLLRPGRIARPSRSTFTACAIRRLRIDAIAAAGARLPRLDRQCRGAGRVRAPPDDGARAAPLLRDRLPGIPTIRVFEALACGIPLVSAPWEDCEGLFRPGTRLPDRARPARDGGASARADCRSGAAREPGRARTARRSLARHTCAHRVRRAARHRRRGSSCDRHGMEAA